MKLASVNLAASFVSEGEVKMPAVCSECSGNWVHDVGDTLSDILKKGKLKHHSCFFSSLGGLNIDR